MVKLEDRESSNGGKRLVLGFDGGCLSCSMLAEDIRRRVGQKLGILSLRDPRVQEWRKEALGEDAPWVPTLFEFDGEKVRVWTGLRMGLALTHSLGFADTWRVMQALGEMRPTSEKKVFGGFSRGQFLKGVGGAAMAMTLLSGAGKFARPAAAHGDHEEIRGGNLVDIARRKVDAPDVINIVEASTVDNDWVERMRTADVVRRCYDDGRCAVVFATGQSCQLLKVRHEKFDTDGYCTIPMVVKHKNIGKDNDNNMLKVAWMVPREDRLILYKEYDHPIPSPRGNFRIATMAKLFRNVSDRRQLRLVRISINGKLRQHTSR